MEQINPVIDSNILQEKANEFAMKGAIETLKDFYSGYNSPFRKMIEGRLKDKGIGGYKMELPDIIAVLNENLSNEVDAIANEAIAKTFIPQVRAFLTRAPQEITFSDFLTKFLDCFDEPSEDDVSLRVEKHERYDWLDVELECKDKTYSITFHKDHNDKSPVNPKRQILSLPNEYRSRGLLSQQTMKLSVDGATLEMPFTKDILKDKFSAYVATLLMGNTKIVMDRDDFSEEMFHHCHC